MRKIFDAEGCNIGMFTWILYQTLHEENNGFACNTVCSLIHELAMTIRYVQLIP